MAYKKPQILWLSDIHLLDPNSPSIVRGISAGRYIKNIISEINKKNFTHIIITGDLSFSGQKDQYDCLNLTFIEPLRNGRKDLRVLTLMGNHDINQEIIKMDLASHGTIYEDLSKMDYDERQNEINDSINISDKCFIEVKPLSKLNKDYRDFFNSYIVKDLEKLKSEGKIDEHFYFNSQGVFGVVIDYEYNIIFNILNSCWFSFGTKNIIGADIKTISNAFNAGNTTKQIEYISQLLCRTEFGNCVLGTLQDQKEYLENQVKERKLLDECFVLSMSHHPFSWLHYSEQYGGEYNKSFQRLVELTDIYISGHQHVSHYRPTIYRGESFYLESPELLDYQIYFQNEHAYKTSEINLGFNIITLDHENSGFQVDQFKPPHVTNFYDIEEFDFLEPDHKVYQLKNKFGIVENDAHDKREIISRKSLIEHFENAVQIHHYLTSNFEIEIENGTLILKDELYSELLKKIISSPDFLSICLPSVHIVSTGNQFYFTISRIPKPGEIREEINNLFEIIKKILESLSILNNPATHNIIEIKFLPLDYWIYVLFSGDIKGDITTRSQYQSFYNRFDQFFIQFKYKLFAPSNIEIHELLKELPPLAITYEIINFELYKTLLKRKLI